jgi:hypothetical protein
MQKQKTIILFLISIILFLFCSLTITVINKDKKYKECLKVNNQNDSCYYIFYEKQER